MTSTGPSTASLEELQSDEQRHVLDTIGQIRMCGLDAVLSLPQLVVCGDQSSGKSSVLEALTGIPFPRSDNLCTRFATEITLRRGPLETVRLRIIPDSARPSAEQTAISSFSEMIQDLAELPAVTEAAKLTMGLNTPTDSKRAFAQDVLSIEIEGPHRPHLTLVDVPGLIQTDTKGVTKHDLDMVRKITDSYIEQPRTICLAVVSGANDYANQGILTRVREVDPEGERTLGIITKPDQLPPGSGSEAAFLSLARNEDIFFKLGWHVVKNRKFEESHYSLRERHASEDSYFRSSNFKELPADSRGVDALRSRLSRLLFDHVKRELPSLRKDLQVALSETISQLDSLGSQRVTSQECRHYLTDLSLTCMGITSDAIRGHYEGDFFVVVGEDDFEVDFEVDSSSCLRRLRAVIQLANNQFATRLRTEGAKYEIGNGRFVGKTDVSQSNNDMPSSPVVLSLAEGRAWVNRVLLRSRGREPMGNYNPLVIGELFWEQSSKWKDVAQQHLWVVSAACQMFFDTLLREKCARDVYTRLSVTKVSEVLKDREQRAHEELDRLLVDKQDFPIIHDPAYAKRLQEARRERTEVDLAASVEAATTRKRLDACQSDHTSAKVDVAAAVRNYGDKVEHDLEQYSCDDVLDSLLSIYAAQQQTFVANVVAQVVERHLVRGLDKVFSPLDIIGMTDGEVMSVAAEPESVKRKRQIYLDRQRKLRQGESIFQKVVGSMF
ncbi:uncharacterized protein HMPREF1541_07976 [Cyphellophora europaea CBS 101466]|uniref:GED domain-containing protein n=1 Tax=Cyphellophora europaea (strain CBS 101466) TaxID=1220924 RepID=W2RMR2_CYPE1|nr:uncharacterized protein HMPREF1541_07976 [Cyphellophora europaea CBS 101466]ETN36988.1 hypothetical protein HMPREF1541_07976 [Cyphellophora europaea CBS 101466]